MSPAPHNCAPVPANPYEAFRQVVYAYGPQRLADQAGMKLGTLYNKADADVDSHAQPTLRDLIAVTRITGDTRVLDSLDRLFDRGSFDLAEVPPSDAALLELLTLVGSEHGAMCSALHRGLSDRRFKAEEYQAVRMEAFDLINAVLAFLHRLEGLVDER